MTTATLAGLVLIGGFVLLLLMRVPISFAMLLATLGSALVTGTNFSVLVRQMVDGANNFSLLSIPFFIVMGEFMSAGGISEKIVDLANLAVGRFRGGLAYVNVLDSMFFGGISGSAVADVSSLGTIVIPMMVKQGYTEDFSVGLTVTTACQGVLIPPSHNMVIYRKHRDFASPEQVHNHRLNAVKKLIRSDKNQQGRGDCDNECVVGVELHVKLAE